jgi:hypothetical protein
MDLIHRDTTMMKKPPVSTVLHDKHEVMIGSPRKMSARKSQEPSSSQKKLTSQKTYPQRSLVDDNQETMMCSPRKLTARKSQYVVHHRKS